MNTKVRANVCSDSSIPSCESLRIDKSGGKFAADESIDFLLVYRILSE